jgi:hypothetical protein
MSLPNNLPGQVEKCDGLLSTEFIIETAQKHKAGDKRERKLTTLTFFWALIASVHRNIGERLISSMVSKIQKLCPDVDISESAVKKQMQRRDWRWLKEVYAHLLKRYWSRLEGIDRDYLEQFVDFRIVDSTVINLVKTLRKRFKATTKDGAALKIHAVFSLKKFVALDIEVTKQAYADVRFKFLKGGGNVLYAFDLGYWCYGLFEEIISRGSFFVSRLKDGSDVVIEEFLCPGYSAFEGHKKTLKELIDCNNLGGTVFDAIVRLGDMKTRVRLVGLLHGGEWYFYVTNITDGKFTPQTIYEIYDLRWQIEIFFKELKSGISLRRIMMKTENTIMLEIYATLIFYLLTRILMPKPKKRPRMKKALGIVKEFLLDVVRPMILGDAVAFRTALDGLLRKLAVRCGVG